MKISEYIEKLKTIAADHGDLEVELYNTSYDRISAREPVVAYKMVLQGRERKPAFWSSYIENAGIRKGEKVCRIT